jgi:hypothetical protein
MSKEVLVKLDESQHGGLLLMADDYHLEGINSLMQKLADYYNASSFGLDIESPNQEAPVNFRAFIDSVHK